MRPFRDKDGDDWTIHALPCTPGVGTAPPASDDIPYTEIFFCRVRDGEGRKGTAPTRDWNHGDVIQTALDRSEEWPPKTH